MSRLLEIRNLSVSFSTQEGELKALQNVSLSLQKGEILALVGKSGCGKSTLCRCLMKLLPASAKITSSGMTANGTDLASCTEHEMKQLRGNLFSMVFQDPLTALNPTIPIGKQISEAVAARYKTLSKTKIRQRVLELMALTGIRNPADQYGRYPCHFSGGMRQRSVLAIALASDPQILLADEPVTALDVTLQSKILDLMQDLCKNTHTSLLLVTHDLGVVARIADRVAVMHAGEIVETGSVEEIFYHPAHPCTRALLLSHPAFAAGGGTLCTKLSCGCQPQDTPACHSPKTDAGAVSLEPASPVCKMTNPPASAIWQPGSQTEKIPITDSLRTPGPANQPQRQTPDQTPDRRPQILPDYQTQRQTPDRGPQILPDCPDPVILDVRNLSHRFRLSGNTVIRALDQVSFQIRRGEIFGLVGESGCGKSTIARCIMNLYKPYRGEIIYRGIHTCKPLERRRHRKMLAQSRQMIFQDSSSSLNPRMKVADIIAEPLVIHHLTPPRGSHRAEAEFQLRHTGMDAAYLDKYPPELSGGMRQRVAIARALAMNPGLLVADEPLASLDASTQAQILRLFAHLQQEHGFTFLFIAHDLSVVRYLCSRAGVMYRGALVETAPVEELFSNPLHPYTRALLASIPVPDPLSGRSRQTSPDTGQDYPHEGTLRLAAPDHLVLVP